MARIAAEHPTRVDAVSLHRLAIVADTHNDLLCSVVVRPVHRWGGYFRERWLPQLCGPAPPATALATTEPEAGSDAAAITTTARRVDGGYVLDGHKKFIGTAPISAWSGASQGTVRFNRAGTG